VIKENQSLPSAFWASGDLAYGHEIVGIAARPSERRALEEFHKRFAQYRPIYRFLCMVTGSRSMVQRATAILKKDIDLLPFPDTPEDLDLSFWEEAICADVINWLGDYVRLGQASQLLRQAADETHLKGYTSIFCRMLGGIYANLKPCSAVRHNGIVCQPFFFGEKPEAPWLEDSGSWSQLEGLVHGRYWGVFRTVRVVRFYAENVIVIVKPDRLRYWIPSTAIRDADETLVDLQEQGW
jgi:hypothetical protein